MKGESLISISDLNSGQIRQLLGQAAELKKSKGKQERRLAGKSLALLFEKPSLRTRVSFDIAMHQLGGHCVYLSPQEVGLGKREPVKDVARTLARYVECIAARTFSHQSVEELCRHAPIPVINALSDEEHPCQALADLLTVLEKKGALKGVKLAYIGDGNNVANSLALGAALTGMEFRFAGPRKYSLKENVLQKARKIAAEQGAGILVTEEATEAVSGADVVYADVWTSMGQEEEARERSAAFMAYQVNDTLLASAAADVIVMHPLPAHHGQEVAEGLLDGPRSVVFDQAENRLHVQKALLAGVMG